MRDSIIISVSLPGVLKSGVFQASGLNALQRSFSRPSADMLVQIRCLGVCLARAGLDEFSVTEPVMFAAPVLITILYTGWRLY